MSHLDYFYRLLSVRITAGFLLFLYVNPFSGLLRNVKFNILLGINTGMLCCIVKLLDEVCVSHTKRVEENKTVLQLNQFAEKISKFSGQFKYARAYMRIG